jgi:hypothetical protein
MTFLGYVYIAYTDTYDVYLSSDDESMMWFGTNAVSGFNGTNTHVNRDQGMNPNTLQLTGNKYYPIRIWYREGGGGNHLQLYLGRSVDGSTNTLYSINNHTTCHCTLTPGLNP